MDTVRRKYVIQPKPYLGGNFGDLSDGTYRVLDGYTGVPVGMAWHVQAEEGGVDYRASCFFFEAELSPRGGGNVHRSAGTFGWGKRYDLAAKAVWEAYVGTLRGRDRVERYVRRYVGLAWFVLGAAVGSIANVVTQGFSAEAASPTQVDRRYTRRSAAVSIFTNPVSMSPSIAGVGSNQIHWRSRLKKS